MCVCVCVCAFKTYINGLVFQFNEKSQDKSQGCLGCMYRSTVIKRSRHNLGEKEEFMGILIVPVWFLQLWLSLLPIYIILAVQIDPFCEKKVYLKISLW